MPTSPDIQALKDAGFITPEATDPPAPQGGQDASVPEDANPNATPGANSAEPKNGNSLDPVVPAIDQPSDQGSATHQPQFGADVLKDIFGEDVDPTLAKDRVSQLRKSAEDRQRAMEVLEMKLNDVSGFANDNIASFNRFVKETGIENYNVYSRIKETDAETAKRNPVDVLVTSEIVKNPEYANEESYFRKEVLRKYGIDSEAELEDIDNQEIKKRLQIDATRSLKEIGEYQAKIKPKEEVDYEAKLKEAEDKREVVRTNLESVVEKVRPNIGKYTYKGAEEGKGEFEFDFDQDTVKGIEKGVIEYMANQKDPYDENAFREAVGLHFQAAVAVNLPKIMAAFEAKIRDVVGEESRQTFVNPSGRADDEPRPVDPNKGMTAEDVFAHERAKYR